jgi:hypothetical protein
VARIRTIKPEFWGDEKMAPLSPITRLVFLGLLSMADDRGRLTDNLKRIDAFIFPETSETSRGSIGELSAIGRIRRGLTASGQRIIEITNWRHQKIEKPNYLGALPDIVQALTDDSPTSRGGIGEASGNGRGGVGDVSVSVSVPAIGISTDIRDQHVRRAKQPRRAPGVVSDQVKYPEFSPADRSECITAWKSKLGLVNVGQLVATLGPMFRPAGDAAHVPHAAIVRGVRDYCCIVTKGRSAPFMGVADLGKKIGALAENAKQYHDDPASRTDGAMLIVHGTTKVAA